MVGESFKSGCVPFKNSFNSVVIILVGLMMCSVSMMGVMGVCRVFGVCMLMGDKDMSSENGVIGTWFGGGELAAVG